VEIVEMRGSGILSIMLVGASMVGCSTYHPRPLNTADLTKTLACFEQEQWVEQATLLNHPRIPPVKLDFSKPLKSRDLAVLGVLISPDLKALRAKEGVAKAQVFDAGLLPDPQFVFSFAHPTDKMQGIVNAYSLGLNWDVGAVATKNIKVKIAKAKAQGVRYDVAWQEWLLANQLELLTARLYYLKQQQHLTQKATTTAKQILDLSEANLKAHNMTIDEFGLRQTTYLEFLNQKVSLERTIRKTVLELNRILGLTPTEKIPLYFKPSFKIINLEADKLFKVAEVNRLDLLALQAGYASVDAQLYQAILGQFPHFILGINKARDNTGIHSVGTDINFDIPLFNRNRGAIKIAVATREQLYLEYNARLNQTRSDIAVLVADLKLIIKEVSILETQLPKMRETEKLMHNGVKEGNITLITYVNILTNLLSNELRLLSLKQDKTEQMIALQIATGKYWGECR